MMQGQGVVGRGQGAGDIGRGAACRLECHLVPEQVEEDWAELRLPDGRRADTGHRHEHVSAGLPYL